MIAFVLFFSCARAFSYEISEETDCWSGSGVRGKGDAQDVYQNYDKRNLVIVMDLILQFITSINVSSPPLDWYMTRDFRPLAGMELLLPTRC